MEVKQVYVTWENPSKIFSIIEDELLEQINTQIYVKNEIYLAMRKNGYNIGGEQSGHIIFSKYASTGDGILTSLKMMEVMMAKKMKMSQLTEDLHIYPQVLVNVKVKDKAVAQADKDVQEAVQKVADALGDTGRILVRESGTEPLIRVMVEAETEEICRKHVDNVVSVIKEKETR